MGNAMGSLLDDCRRCSIDQCEMCPGVGVLQRSNTRSGDAGPQAGQVGFNRHQEFQPNLSEAQLLEQALQASLPQGPPTEAELAAQARRRAKAAEESRQRQRLRDEQEAELEESLRIDREREMEKALRKKEEEEAARRAAEEEEGRRQKAEQEAAEAAKAEEERRAQIRTTIEQAQQALSPEPEKGVAGRVEVVVKMPDGRRMQRGFHNNEAVAQLYHYVHAEGGEAMAEQRFRLVATMPRQLYEDKEMTLEAAGLQGQCALLIEVLDDDDE